MGTTKRDIAQRIAERLECRKDLARQVIQAFLDEMVSELAEGHTLEFREFGIFDVRTRKPRIARNPRTGETVLVPPKRAVHFRAGRIMKARIGGQDAMPDGTT